MTYFYTKNIILLYIILEAIGILWYCFKQVKFILRKLDYIEWKNIDLHNICKKKVNS